MADHRIVRSVRHVEASIVDGLREAGSSTVYEASGRRGLLPSRLRPVGATRTIAGAAVTVSLPPDDNLMIHAAVECCGPGDVLLVVPTEPSACAMIGELLATSLAARGVAGIVVDAGVRDVAALREMGFAAWASLVTPAGTTKSRAGSVNVPVALDGITVDPGDVIIADDDGVVAVPAAYAPAILDASRARLAAEAVKRRDFAAGVLGLDMYGLRQVLAGLGVATEDRTDRSDG
jgi:4-hydroxy-4-methyl-2-oxoglutarate aldolase